MATWCPPGSTQTRKDRLTTTRTNIPRLIACDTSQQLALSTFPIASRRTSRVSKMPTETPLVQVRTQQGGDLLVLSNKRTPDNPSLLDLPLEVRLIIYNYIFDDAVIEIRFASEGNNRRQDWFASDRNLLSHKFTNTSILRPHIWRPRTQILGTCRQIHEEIISLGCYHLELNCALDRYWSSMQKHLTPFLWSHVTTFSSSRCRQWLYCFEDRPPALRHCYTNKPFNARSAGQTADRFNGICTMPYVCWRNTKDLEAVKAGMKDEEIFSKAESMHFDSRHSWMEVGRLMESSLSGEEDNLSLYARVRIVVLPTSLDFSLPESRRYEYPSWFWLYPQLVGQKSESRPPTKTMLTTNRSSSQSGVPIRTAR